MADIDGDARPDLFVATPEASMVLHQTPGGAFTPVALTQDAGRRRGPDPDDLDLDGAVDVVWSGADGAGQAVYGLALDTAVAAPLPQIEGARGPLMVAEVDAPDPYASPVLDVVTMRGADLVAISPEGDLDSSIYLKFIGKKDNRQGVGAIVEVRAGKVYRRIFLRGGAEVVGIGDQDYADVVRITWPNGVVSQETDVEKGAQFMLDNDTFAEQQEGLIGSCPFLYTWNGETFEFISDVIGITPLGLPMAPGMLVPPDHDEYVLVRGDQLVPDENGELVMQFTEELREVTYLDRVRLDVVDHPASADVYPNERFTFPPFPEPHTHTVVHRRRQEGHRERREGLDRGASGAGLPPSGALRAPRRGSTSVSPSPTSSSSSSTPPTSRARSSSASSPPAGSSGATRASTSPPPRPRASASSRR